MGRDRGSGDADVTCRQCREAVSARLDGEDDSPAPAVDAHLAGCAACRAFADGAAAVTRLARTRPAEAVPDLVPMLLDAWQPPRRRQWPLDLVRLGLAGVAVGQLALAITGIAMAAAGAPAAGPMNMAELDGASAVHFSHESAAWNLALGVAFAGVALGRRRSVAGLVPTVAAFVGVLAALSVPDLLAGRVDVARLLGHGLVVAGLGLLLAYRALTRGQGGAPDSRRRSTGSSPSTTARPRPTFRAVDDAGGPAAPEFGPTGRRAA